MDENIETPPRTDGFITLIDPLLGEISARQLDGHVSVQGKEIPPAELVNTGHERRDGIPIGTRRAGDLRLVVDGREWALRPGPAKLTRRSYRVAVDAPGDALLFTPSGPETSRLVRGHRYRGDNELGQFTRTADGTVLATWSEDMTALGVTAKALRPVPAEVAAGYVLALGFGTGAQFFLAGMMSALGRSMPG